MTRVESSTVPWLCMGFRSRLLPRQIVASGGCVLSSVFKGVSPGAQDAVDTHPAVRVRSGVGTSVLMSDANGDRKAFCVRTCSLRADGRVF